MLQRSPFFFDKYFCFQKIVYAIIMKQQFHYYSENYKNSVGSGFACDPGLNDKPKVKIKED